MKFFAMVRLEKFPWRNEKSPSHPKIFLAVRSFLKHRRFPDKNFRYSDTGKLRQKNVISPSLIHAIFSLPELFWNTEEFVMHFFGNMTQKQIWGSFPMAPVLSMYFLLYQYFSETTKSSQWKNSVMRDKKSSTEKRDFPSLKQKFLSPPQFFWNTELFLLSFAGNVRQKNIRRKRWYPKRIHEKFSMQEVFLKSEAFLLNFFGTVKQKKIRWRNMISPRIQKIFAPPEVFLNTELIPLSFFDNVRQKNLFDEKLISPANPWKVFDERKFFWNNKKFAKKLSGNVRQKNLCWRNVISTSRPKFVFAARSFLKQWRVPNENFRNCDTKNLRRKNVISPCVIHKKILLPEVFWKTDELPLKTFGNVRQEKCYRRTWCAPSHPLKVYAARNFLKQWRVPNENFWNCDTEKLRQDRKTRNPLLSCIEFSR